MEQPSSKSWRTARPLVEGSSPASSLPMTAKRRKEEAKATARMFLQRHWTASTPEEVISAVKAVSKKPGGLEQRSQKGSASPLEVVLGLAERITDVHHTTILSLLTEGGGSGHRIFEKYMRNLRRRYVQADELGCAQRRGCRPDGAQLCLDRTGPGLRHGGLDCLRHAVRVQVGPLPRLPTMVCVSRLTTAAIPYSFPAAVRFLAQAVGGLGNSPSLSRGQPSHELTIMRASRR